MANRKPKAGAPKRVAAPTAPAGRPAAEAKVDPKPAPVKAEPPKGEPVKTAPVKAEPKAEPVKAAAKSAPAPAKPIEAQPAKVEAVKAEPVKAEPVKADPVQAEPVQAEVVAAAAAPLKAAEEILEDAAPASIEAAAAVVEAETVLVEAEFEVVETVVNTIAEGTKTMTNETINRVQESQKVAADRFQAAFGDINERAKGAIEKGVRLVEELTDLTKGNVEAFVASSKVAARGVEQLGQEAADYSRRSFEEASVALKSFAEVRSPTDFFKLQSDYARTAFDSLVTESSKVSESVIKLAGEVAEPITTRYSVAAERVKSVAL